MAGGIFVDSARADREQGSIELHCLELIRDRGLDIFRQREAQKQLSDLFGVFGQPVEMAMWIETVSPDDATGTLERIYQSSLDQFGFVPNIRRALSLSPETLRAYLHDHPSTGWTLNRVANHLVAWLEERCNPRQLVEMAMLDRAVQAGFEAGDGTPIDPAALVQMPPLKLQPHVTLLPLNHNVHWIRSAVLAGAESIPDLEEGFYPVVVFRRGIKMRHWQMPRGAFEILRGIDDGLSVEAAIDRAFNEGVLNAETLATDIGTWFKDFAERNLVEIA